ncbi:MAG: arginine--tRNA ligase [bacterium]|nr:arginine--tRNA ligase [bacterium]
MQFSATAALAFRELYPEAYQATGDSQVFAASDIAAMIEKPKDASMGRFALPVFRFSKLLGAKPPEIASSVSGKVNNLLADSAEAALISTESIAGFINIRTEPKAQAQETIGRILEQREKYGADNSGRDQTVLVEYSSVNIARPFGVGHLRTTILGNSLRRVFGKFGYNVVGINFLGDWGTQFGKMIVAYQKYAGEENTNKEDVKDLVRLYVRFHEEAEKDDSLNDQARKAFQLLEQGDAEMLHLWEQFKNVSLKEFHRIYEILGVEFDVITGEAALNDKMEPVIERLKKANLTSISDGALIVDLKDDQLPPALLKKQDGATLYATRDIAGLAERWEKYHFAESLYVVGSSQADHFKQAFKVMAMLEEAEGLPEEDRMTGKVKHILFGWVKFGDKTLSTRAGKIIFLEDVLIRATELAMEKVAEKSPELIEQSTQKSGLGDYPKIAEDIGVGAVIFSQMSVRRQKDVSFIWEEVLSFEGESGPYLQYTHARLSSLLKNGGLEITPDIDFSLLVGDEEQRVIELLDDYPQVLKDAARDYEPYLITAQLLKIAAAFNKVYQRKDETGRSDKIISDDLPRTRARLALVSAVRTVIADGLYLLGLKAPEKM